MHSYSDTDLSTSTTRELIDELARERRDRALATDTYEKRAHELRVEEIQRWIAIHNTRATARLGGMSEERLLEIEALVRDFRDDIGSNPADRASWVVLDPDQHRRTVIVLGEVVDEVRRLQGEVAAMIPRYLPPAAEDFGAEPVVPHPLEIEVTSAAEIAAREQLFEEMSGVVGEVHEVDGIAVVRVV